MSKVVKKLNPFSKEERVGDAILRPDGTIVRTDPRDTLIATKNPGGGGGGGVNINFYGLTMDEAIMKVKRELGSKGVTATRF